MAGTISSSSTERAIEPTRESRAARPRRRRSVVSSIAIVATMLLLGGLLTSCETTEADRRAVINEINASRARAGIPGLREHGTLNSKADQWASQMRDQCRISHSHLATGAPPEWRKLGENVGRGGSIAQVHVAYMNSSGHRANILDRSFNYVGAGAVWGTCNGYRTVFTVQVFMRA